MINSAEPTHSKSHINVGAANKIIFRHLLYKGVEFLQNFVEIFTYKLIKLSYKSSYLYT